MTAPVVCTIGATEPWNAAGIGLDLRALAACGARAVAVVAGVTAQDRAGVHGAAPVPPQLIAAQFAALTQAGIAAYRIGALLDEPSVEAVAAYFETLPRAAARPIVYDPALAPTGGGTFASDAVVATIVRRIVPLVTIVTPNLSEAARLSGVPPLLTPDDMALGANALLRLGAAAALVTGGHLAGDPCDVLVDASGIVFYRAPRLAGTLRGTGCLLACALAAGLARGEPLRDAVRRARAFVRARFASSEEAGGMRLAY